MRLLAALIMLVALPAAAAPDAASVAARLAAHRATYKLRLGSARGDVVAAGGSMTYEVSDACDGWASHQRLQMTLTNRDGQNVQMVSDYTTFETKDGRQLRFRMRQTTDEAVTEQVEGDARLDRSGGTGQVHYRVPADKTLPLPQGTLLPMMHTATIIAAAEQGRKFLSVPLFDGTGPDGAQDSSIVVTSWDGPRPARYAPLSALPSGRVHVAFFERAKAETLPDYEVAMRYWENGVADDLQMDFGQFVMEGDLAEFTLLPSHC